MRDRLPRRRHRARRGRAERHGLQPLRRHPFLLQQLPYKVRRFNYFAFAEEERRPPIARNPDVTVRARGVMEKCTFCLQRIAAARIDADADNRPIGADEVQTACQAACPTQAFTFGNMAEGGQVTERKKSPLTYALLDDQDTRPASPTRPGFAMPDRAPAHDAIRPRRAARQQQSGHDRPCVGHRAAVAGVRLVVDRDHHCRRR